MNYNQSCIYNYLSLSIHTHKIKKKKLTNKIDHTRQSISIIIAHDNSWLIFLLFYIDFRFAVTSKIFARDHAKKELKCLSTELAQQTFVSDCKKKKSNDATYTNN